MSQAQPEIKQDSVQIEADFSMGIVRDLSRPMIPDGGVYDAVDYMLEQPGRAYKRGGWLRHSAALPAPPSCVFSFHIPTRVGAIVNGELYDVTSETGPQATARGTIGFSPAENPTIHLNSAILCDPTYVNRPKRVYPAGAAGDLTIQELSPTAPRAAHSAIYASRIVLARGQTDADMGAIEHIDRLWFSSLPGDILGGGLTPPGDWDVDNMYIDTSYEITGLAAIQGILLIFSPRFTERIINGVPPGQQGEDMVLQPVGGVGCLDARSIAVANNQVIFASEEGVFLTEGVGFENLMEKSDRSGILSYWRSLFQMVARTDIRSICGGFLMRDYYMLSTTLYQEGVGIHRRDDFICYLPTRSWWRTTNCYSNMFAQGASEQENIETYAALAHDPYVARMNTILRPMWANRKDGNGVAVAPVLETRAISQGPGLKAYGFGRITRDIQVPHPGGSEYTGWSASTAYAVNATIFRNGTVWRATTAGTSGATEPLWYLSDNVGDTIVDGGVSWINEGPRLKISKAFGIEAEVYVPVPEGDLRPADSVFIVTPTRADRTRVSLFGDSQAVSLRIQQEGASEQTEIFAVEIESRPYELAADGE